MTLPLKGLWKDSPKSLHPQDSAFEVVNGIIRKNLKAYTNEPGCIEHSIDYNALGYKQVGIFNAKYGDKIVFSIGSDNKSKIGIIKADGTYVEKLSEFLGFDEDFPIDCESYYNYKGELNIAFTDYNMTPKLVNLDDIKMPFNINDIQLFSFFRQPQVTPTIEETGGSLKTGAWFPFFAFKDSTSMTPFTSVGNPVFINRETISQGYNNYDGDPAGSPSSKSIKLTLENVDTNYETLVVGFVSKIDGVLEARIVKEVPITGESMVTFFTGGEASTLISLEQLLTSSSVYDRIKHLTQVDGVLYGAGTAESSPINFQRYANLIRLKYITRQVHHNPNAGFFGAGMLDASYKVNAQNNLFKGWASQEVYAFFIKVKVKGRGLSDAFLISGRPPEGNETAYFSTLGAGYDVQKSISPTAKKYQIDDTAGANGKFGYWENEDEYYPNTDDFAPVNGSEDLRGKRVRHHKFPSISKLRELGLDYSSVVGAQYGVNWMHALGIEIESFPTLPQELADQIEGYQIFYAKRSADNSLVSGQSLLLFNSVKAQNDGKFYWSGGNWEVDVNTRIPGIGGDNWVDFFNLNSASVRLNSFDLRLDKPIINPTYLNAHVKIRKTIPNTIITYKKGRYYFGIDYSTGNSTSVAINPADRIKKINSFRYIPANTNVEDYVNIIGEETAVAKVEGTYNFEWGALKTGMYVDTVNTSITVEETFLANLMAYKTNLYNSYFLQELASTNRYLKITDTNRQIWGGDINIVLDSYVAFAPATPQQLADPQGQNPVIGDPGEHDDIKWATKVLRAYLKESINNADLRHEIDGEPYTNYYPKHGFSANDVWFQDFHRTTNPNRIAYNKDYSSIGDLNPSVIASKENTFVAEDPYKIIRSRIPSAEERDSSWKVFLANDYYIIPKDKGFITNIQGVGKDLFINCEFTLLKTQGAEELATNTFKVVLGTGNIFERPPIELILDEDGYAGCQHKFSCLLTRYGYFFVDEDRKKVFLANSTVKDITTGLENTFRKDLLTSGDNPYRDKGYTAAWDDEFSRIILASKEAGFTRSYDPDMESWVSKHTYLPTQMIGDRNSLFALHNGKIYKHNIPEVRGIYYNPNQIDPFIVVFIARDTEKQISLASIQWSTNVIVDGNNLKDLTFNSVLAWNSYQTTDVIQVHPFSKQLSLEQNFDNTNARRIKNIWNFNSLKDVLKDANQKFIDDIDLIPNTTDANRDFYLKKMLSDDYVAIKLLFSNQKINTLQAEIQLLNFGVNGNIVAR